MDLNINLKVSFEGMKQSIDVNVDKVLDFLKEIFSQKNEPQPAIQGVKVVAVQDNQLSKTVQEETNKKVVEASEQLTRPKEKEQTPVKHQEKKKEKHGHICRIVRKLTDKDKEDLLAAAELLDEKYDGKSVSFIQFMSRLIKTARLPICTHTTVLKVIGDKFDFSWYHRNIHQNSVELSHDAAVLLHCGLPEGMVGILTEQSMSGKNTEYIYSLTKYVKEEDVARVHSKYQKELEVFGIEDLSLKDDWAVSLDENRKALAYHRRPKYPYDDVNRLVVCYQMVTSEGLKGEKAVVEAGKKAKVKACPETLKRLIFDHKNIPGYETIPTPYQQREREDVRKPETLENVKKVKFLFKQRGMSYTQIAQETGVKKSSIYKICSGITFSQVIVDPDTEKMLEEEYPVEPSFHHE